MTVIITLYITYHYTVIQPTICVALQFLSVLLSYVVRSDGRRRTVTNFSKKGQDYRVVMPIHDQVQNTYYWTKSKREYKSWWINLCSAVIRTRAWLTNCSHYHRLLRTANMTTLQQPRIPFPTTLHPRKQARKRVLRLFYTHESKQEREYYTSCWVDNAFYPLQPNHS